MLASSAYSTTSTAVTTCPVCPNAPWSRVRTRWTASYPVPQRKRSSPSSWWSPLLSAYSCVYVRFSISSANATRRRLWLRLQERGRCLPRVRKWRNWQNTGQSPEPKVDWIWQYLFRTSITQRLRRGYLRNDNRWQQQCWKKYSRCQCKQMHSSDSTENCCSSLMTINSMISETVFTKYYYVE